jgi:hypothetical protein
VAVCSLVIVGQVEDKRSMREIANSSRKNDKRSSRRRWGEEFGVGRKI